MTRCELRSRYITYSAFQSSGIQHSLDAWSALGVLDNLTEKSDKLATLLAGLPRWTCELIMWMDWSGKMWRGAADAQDAGREEKQVAIEVKQ